MNYGLYFLCVFLGYCMVDLKSKVKDLEKQNNEIKSVTVNLFKELRSVEKTGLENVNKILDILKKITG